MLDGHRPGLEEFVTRVSGFWLPDEVVLYVGLAGTSLRDRVGQYYRTPLGHNKPHAGGWFLKLLGCLDQLTVHFAACDDPSTAEYRMIEAFCNAVSDSTRELLADPECPFPFANLEWPRGRRKRHGITGATADPTKGPATPGWSTAERSRAPARPRRSIDLDAINAHIQQQLRSRGMDAVTAVEAARWLAGEGLLKDSPHRPGLPLRELLRNGKIVGQRQEANGRWFIHRA